MIKIIKNCIDQQAVWEYNKVVQFHPLEAMIEGVFERIWYYV